MHKTWGTFAALEKLILKMKKKLCNERNDSKLLVNLLSRIV
jgi:hypothetical protein